MSTAQHTPGPWFIDNTAKRFAEPGHVAISAANHRVLAQVVVRMDDEDEDSGGLLANARLIAAAPAMLAALKDCRRALELAGASGELAVVDAAISKATGEQA